MTICVSIRAFTDRLCRFAGQCTAARAVALLDSAPDRLVARDIVPLRDAFEYTGLLIGEIDNSSHIS